MGPFYRVSIAKKYFHFVKSWSLSNCLPQPIAITSILLFFFCLNLWICSNVNWYECDMAHSTFWYCALQIYYDDVVAINDMLPIQFLLSLLLIFFLINIITIITAKYYYNQTRCIHILHKLNFVLSILSRLFRTNVMLVNEAIHKIKYMDLKTANANANNNNENNNEEKR